MIDNVTMSRSIADNIMLNKHDIIQALPMVNSSNPKRIEEVTGSSLRVLRKYPIGFDFTINMINIAKKSGEISKYVEDLGREYYKIEVQKKSLNSYLASCGEHTIRQSLYRQIITDLSFGYVKILSKGKNFIDYKAPFRIMGFRVFKNSETIIYKIHLLKDIFESLVIGECYNNGGEGFITIPGELYPTLTKTDKGELQSYNPAYKLIVFGVGKNTNRKSSIQVDKKELLRTTVPEYYRNGTLDKLTITSFQASMKGILRHIQKIFPKKGLPSSFYIGKYNEKSKLYYNNPKQK
jgi:hypothetical protein